MKVIKNWTKLIDKEISIVKRKRWDLIYVGRFDPVKNLDRLVRVVWKMKKEGRKVSSLFLGDGKERDKLKQMVVRLNLTNNIEFRGPVDNVEWYLNRAKIFVLTSKTEASPLAILEAMAVGVPVVVPNYSGAEELVANKKTGFIYQNEQEMLDIITRLLRDNKLREKITRTARSYVKANHSKKIIQQYIRILTN